MRIYHIIHNQKEIITCEQVKYIELNKSIECIQINGHLCCFELRDEIGAGSIEKFPYNSEIIYGVLDYFVSKNLLIKMLIVCDKYGCDNSNYSKECLIKIFKLFPQNFYCYESDEMFWKQEDYISELGVYINSDNAICDYDYSTNKYMEYHLESNQDLYTNPEYHKLVKNEENARVFYIPADVEYTIEENYSNIPYIIEKHRTWSSING